MTEAPYPVPAPVAPTAARPSAHHLVALGFSLAGLAAAAITLRDLDGGAFLGAIAGADPGALIGAFVAVQVASVAKGLRWRALLAPSRPSLILLVALVYVGQLANNLLPTRAGDLARIELLARRTGADRATVLGTVAAEKLLDLVLLGMLALLVVPLAPALPSLGSRPVLLALPAGVALAGVALPLGRRFERARSGRSAIARLALRVAAGARALRTTRGLVGVLGWSLVAWAAGGLGNLWTLVALGVDRPWLPALMLLVAIYAGMPIPSLPGRVGLHQAISLAALAPFALGDTVALATALIVYATSIVFPCLAGAVTLYWLGGRLPAAAERRQSIAVEPRAP